MYKKLRLFRRPVCARTGAIKQVTRASAPSNALRNGSTYPPAVRIALAIIANRQVGDAQASPSG